MKIDFQKKDNCCGCTACVSACPTNAISMEEDNNGFLYPMIDEKVCVSCGLCRKVCDFNSDEHFHHGAKPLAAYAVKHIKNDVRSASRSGGVFTAITDYILDNDGCVFGAAFDDNFNVHHIKCETKEERDILRGSKYVQSDLRSIFSQVKKELEKDRLVAFSGTACQVAGLYAFLRKDYSNLITFDLVCHGVPSPKLWRDYIKLVERRINIKTANFRDKQLMGWDLHIESFSNGKKKIYKRDYTELFYKNVSLRESCFSCKYTNLSRPGDFTLADFWGLEKHQPGFDDNKGVSLLFINSDKAEKIFMDDMIQKDLDARKCDSYDFVHPNLNAPEKKPLEYDSFWDDYNNKGIEYILKKYCYTNSIMHMKQIFRYIKKYINRRVINH